MRYCRRLPILIPTMTSRPQPPVRRQKKTVHDDLYEQPGHLIRRANQICMGLFAELVSTDITPIQYAILRAVHETPGIDQVSLARATALDTSTAALTAARLEGKGLLNRDPSEVDKRQRVLTLSPAGEALIVGLVTDVHAMRKRLLGTFAPDEREQFMALLRKFVHLNNERSRAPMRSASRRSDDVPDAVE